MRGASNSDPNLRTLHWCAWCGGDCRCDERDALREELRAAGYPLPYVARVATGCPECDSGNRPHTLDHEGKP